jgi:hypothetical protein
MFERGDRKYDDIFRQIVQKIEQIGTLQPERDTPTRLVNNAIGGDQHRLSLRFGNGSNTPAEHR